mgnify:CR=1 FL=1
MIQSLYISPSNAYTCLRFALVAHHMPNVRPVYYAAVRVPPVLFRAEDHRCGDSQDACGTDHVVDTMAAVRKMKDEFKPN